MTQKNCVFVLNLLQDVNIVRSLVYLVQREFGYPITFLVTSKFIDRDTQKIWQREIAQICGEICGTTHVFATPLNGLAILQDKGGFLIAASESSLSGHAETHDLFRIAPASFLKITLQHGYECVGFLQNREHDMAHGRNVTFAADVICGWASAASLRSLTVSERPKLYVTGPSTVLQVPNPVAADVQTSGGLVCENLHSVRLHINGDFRQSFMDIFFRFCAVMDEVGQGVTLRPHPGGQYVLKNKVPLPANVRLNNRPMYKVDLKSYAFGVSAPSTVVLDMLLAQIPVAIWRDEEAVMDTGNYDGLITISGVEDWIAFARDASVRPEMLLDRQRRFLERSAVVTDPAEVYARFARLFANGAATGPRIEVRTSPPPPRRVLFIANGLIPTLQLSFLKPLNQLRERGDMELEVVTELDITAAFEQEFRSEQAGDWLIAKIDAFAPDVIVCCRYSGPHSDRLTAYARERTIPLIYHVDDDLLNIPKEIGQRKYRAHNRPERIASVRHLLTSADLVYCSTKQLARRFRAQGVSSPMLAGDLYCAGGVLRPAELRVVRKIGYMGFDHAHDFELVLPMLIRYLRLHEEVAFDLFGSIPLPEALLEFGDRVTVIPPVPVYEQFLQAFAELDWDIGICPLAATPFNAVKANTKWVEYTSVGAAVIATRGLVYDDCCSDGCGMLADSPDQWLTALEALTIDPEARYRMVQRAQEKLIVDYSNSRLQSQILKVFASGRRIVDDRCSAAWSHVASGRLASSAVRPPDR